MPLTEPAYQKNGTVVHLGHSPDVLQGLPSELVHCCVTSPPYWKLRDYGTEPQVWGGKPDCDHDWETARYYAEGGGGAGSSREAFSKPGPENAARIKKARWREDETCSKCSAWKGQLGLEPTPEMYVEHLVGIFREVRRVLRDDGTLWLNLGDTYAGSSKGSFGGQDKSGLTSTQTQENAPTGLDKRGSGLRPKDLVGIPWRVAFALQADGWYLRSDIIWAKQCCMPESVKDRPTRAHEYLFLMTKSSRYYYDSEAIKEEAQPREDSRAFGKAGDNRHGEEGRVYVPSSGKHSRRPPNAGGRRIVENVARARASGADYQHPFGYSRNKRTVWTMPTQPFPEAHYAVFPEALPEICIKAGCPAGGTVLDPFVGAGTTLKVARDLGCHGIGIELNPKDIDIIKGRLEQQVLAFG